MTHKRRSSAAAHCANHWLACTIDVLPVAYLDDVYYQISITHLIDNPIVPLTYAVEVATRKLLTARWPWFIGKILNLANKALPIFLSRDSFEFLQSKCQIWCTGFMIQAALLLIILWSTPSINFTPAMTSAS